MRINKAVSAVKLCKFCGYLKDEEAFSRNGKYPYSKCRVCRADAHIETYPHNRDQIIKAQAAYRAANPDKMKAKAKREYLKNPNRERRVSPEKQAEYTRRYRKKYPERVCSLVIKRRHDRNRAMPRWANLAKIAAVYDEAARLTKETGVFHEVDHIVPLKGKTVCGLHWEGNLQPLPKAENRAKQNRHWPDMPA